MMRATAAQGKNRAENRCLISMVIRETWNKRSYLLLLSRSHGRGGQQVLVITAVGGLRFEKRHGRLRGPGSRMMWERGEVKLDTTDGPERPSALRWRTAEQPVSLLGAVSRHQSFRRLSAGRSTTMSRCSLPVYIQERMHAMKERQKTVRHFKNLRDVKRL